MPEPISLGRALAELLESRSQWDSLVALLHKQPGDPEDRGEGERVEGQDVGSWILLVQSWAPSVLFHDLE